MPRLHPVRAFDVHGATIAEGAWALERIPIGSNRDALLIS